MNIKIGMIALLLGFALMLAIPRAHAEDQCPGANITQLINEADKVGMTSTVLSDSLVKALEAAVGRPPSLPADKAYAAIRLDKDGLSKIVIAVDGCLTSDKIGPVPAEMLDAKIGIVNG